MVVAEFILFVALAYLLCGTAVGLPFVLRGVDRVDASARGTTLGFRLLILPGSVALWPLVLTKWMNAARREGRT